MDATAREIIKGIGILEQGRYPDDHREGQYMLYLGMHISLQELMGSDFREMDVDKIDTRVPRVSKPSNYNKLNLYHHQYYVESSDRTVIVPLNFFDCILISL